MTTWHFGDGKSLGEIGSSYFIAAPEALGIGAASFAERSGKWDSGTGIWEFGDFFERGEMERAKI